MVAVVRGKYSGHLFFFTLSLPRVINFKFLLQPHQNYYATQYEELSFSSLTQIVQRNSHCITYTFLYDKFELGSERVNNRIPF